MRSHRKVAFLFWMVYAATMANSRNFHPGIFADMPIIPSDPFSVGRYDYHNSFDRVTDVVVDEVNFILKHIVIGTIEYSRTYYAGGGKKSFISKFIIHTKNHVITKLEFDENLYGIKIYRENGDSVTVRGSPLAYFTSTMSYEAMVEPPIMKQFSDQLISMVEDFVGAQLSDLSDIA